MYCVEVGFYGDTHPYLRYYYRVELTAEAKRQELIASEDRYDWINTHSFRLEDEDE